MQILNRDELERGGFAGLKETRLVMDPRVFSGRSNTGTWPGVGNLVYLADARFLPKGETGLHGHKEIDVISVMVEGRIGHEGSLKHGQELAGNMIQVQRAGGEGFEHNEINPDDRENRMIQLWVLPETPGGPAGYKLYAAAEGETVRVYGGGAGQDETYASQTVIGVAQVEPGQTIELTTPSLAYVTAGGGTANGEIVKEGDLIQSDGIRFEASNAAQLILVHTGE